MRNFLLLLVSVTGINLLIFISVAAETMSILTAEEEGTYYQIGKDIQKMVYPDIDLEIVASQGSLTNIMFLGGDSDYELALVQQDVLASTPGEFLSSGQLKIVLPLYREEVHLLTHSGINQISDLKNKKVSVGINGSGTYITARNLLKRVGVEPKKVYLREWRALEALVKDDIDALFYVIGYPASLFEKGIERKDNLHLIPIILEDNKMFLPALIPEETYEWQSKAVKTVSVLSVLVTRQYEIDDPKCTQIGYLVKMIQKNLNKLREKGHEKWKNIEVSAALLKAQDNISPCSLKAFDN